MTEEAEPTEDITTELVKENPYRYAAYYCDRKTQYYYLQARYYDPRPTRSTSHDPEE
ncbi:RHS repeat-associated core domain-containing protein [Paenibacillus durus]|uniref:RHS repeat-associated core domain-containing protein n=1 Tax=Paenibacillus durus TaxID=44251 RepID=UPI0004B0B0C6|nr:RHS repeat-associated core domain-containing protein [Paenibacillus durus]